jgi:hypothetical protein
MAQDYLAAWADLALRWKPEIVEYETYPKPIDASADDDIEAEPIAPADSLFSEVVQSSEDGVASPSDTSASDDMDDAAPQGDDIATVEDQAVLVRPRRRKSQGTRRR